MRRHSQEQLTATLQKCVHEASIADIDLWMMDPAQHILSFQNKTIPGAHLEKDDLGASNDTVWVNGKKVTNPNNNEVIHIQTLQPGTYYVSVHMYNNRTEKGPHKVTVTACQRVVENYFVKAIGQALSQNRYKRYFSAADC